MGAADRVENNKMLEVLSGSHLYGTNTPESDFDYVGVFMPDEDLVFGFEVADEVDLSVTVKGNDGRNTKDAVDRKFYEFRKFVKLALQNNPNVIELLFAPTQNVEFVNSYGKELLSYADLFPFAGCKERFLGYAFGQKHRMVVRSDKYSELKLAVEYFSEALSDENDPVHEKMLVAELKNKKLPFMKWDVKGNPHKNVDHNQVLVRVGDVNVQAHLQVRRMLKMLNERLEKATNRTHLMDKYGFDCYHEDTEFLTKSGWKLYDDITDNEKIATFNKENKKLEFQLPYERVKKKYNGKMYNYSGLYTSFNVTPNHRMFVSPAHRNRKNGFSTKYEEIKSAWNIIPMSDILKGRRSHFHIMSSIISNNVDYDIDDEYLKLVGFYVSEGTVQFRNNKIKSIGISQTNKGKKDFFDQMDSISDKYNFKKYDHQRPERNLIETLWVSHDKIKHKLYQECGHINKRLPKWIHKLSQRQTNILLYSLILGDGYDKNKKCFVYYTKSRQLAGDIQTLALISGKKCNMCGPYVYKSNYTKKPLTMYQVSFRKEIESYDCIRLFLTENRIQRRPSGKFVNPGVEEYYYNGNIVCFSVPNELLITRYNGKIAIQGNTKFASHLLRLLLEGKELLKTGMLQFPLKDRQLLLDVKEGKWDMRDVLNFSDELELEVEDLYKQTVLPKSPRYEEVSSLTKKMLKNFLMGL